MDDTLISQARELYLSGELPTPEELPCVCKQPRSAHSGASHSGGCADSGCRRFRADRVVQLAVEAAQAETRTFHQDLAEYDRRTRARVKKKRKGVISVRPSDVGACRRSVWYREAPPEGFVPDPSNRGAAWMGGIIHEEFLRRRRALYPWRWYGDLRGREVFLPGMERPYRYDEYDPITATLISIKTAGGWRWDQVGQYGVDENWVDQDHLYALCLIALGHPVDRIIVLVIERADGKSESFTTPYDPARAARALAKVHNLVEMIENDIVPPRDRNGPTNDGICRNCFARSHCWSIPQAEAQGRSPENLTLVGDNPADEFVEAIATEIIELRGTEKVAEERRKVLQTLLDGVELRPYGEVEGVPGAKSTPAWKEWQAHVEEINKLPDGMRPAQLPEPPINKSRYVTWKFLRKATRDRLAKEKAAREAEAQAAREAELQAQLDELAAAS